MLNIGVGFRVPAHSLLLLGSLILLPAWARADDFSFSGDSTGCSDPPPITMQQFSVTPNMSGGLCLAFGNHSGVTFGSLKFTAPFPNANVDDALQCSPGPFFASCDFVVDGRKYDSGAHVTAGNTITVEFSGNADFPGIPDAGDRTNNFVINLNNPDAAGGQPTSDAGAGDWLLNGHPDVFEAVANDAVVPEPRYGWVVLAMLGALVARIWMAKTGETQQRNRL